MRREGDEQPVARDLLGGEIREDRLDGRRAPGNHDAVGRIDGRDRDVSGMSGDRRGDRVDRRIDGRHGAAGRQRLREPAALAHETQSVRQTEDARHAGRRIFAERMAYDGGRFDPE